MRIINKTKYPDQEVRRLVRLGMRGLDTKGVPITILASRKHAHGHAWWGWRQYIEIWLPPANTFPKRPWRRHRSSPMNHDWQNWQEALVAISAHEGRHIDIYRSGWLRKSRPKQQIEMNCEAWEHKVLQGYRQSHSEQV